MFEDSGNWEALQGEACLGGDCNDFIPGNRPSGWKGEGWAGLGLPAAVTTKPDGMTDHLVEGASLQWPGTYKRFSFIGCPLPLLSGHHSKRFLRSK